VISTTEVLLRLFAAAVLGGVIGINRGRLEWAAGMRTHMLVSVGAALAIIVSAYGFQHALTYDHVVLDPSRIAAQVVSGIGFLGAGTILFLEREQVVRGLTTAAGLWAVASVGLAAGAGLFIPAIAATVILWAILAILKPIERRWVRPRPTHTSIAMELSDMTVLSSVEKTLETFEVPIKHLRMRRAPSGVYAIDVRFVRTIETKKLSDMAKACGVIDGVNAVHINLRRPGAADAHASP
jgi:putative Mg2+ transporter-C (MgtC) family protein